MSSKSSGNSSMFNIEIPSRERANLLQLILEALLKKAARDSRRLNKLKNAEGRYRIRAGRMECYLEIRPEGAVIDRYTGQEIDAFIRGTIDAFFRLGTGSLSPVPLLTGRLKIKGKFRAAANLGLALRG